MYPQEQGNLAQKPIPSAQGVCLNTGVLRRCKARLERAKSPQPSQGVMDGSVVGLFDPWPHQKPVPPVNIPITTKIG